MEQPGEDTGAAQYAASGTDSTRQRTLQWQDPMATLGRAAAMSGLEYMEATLDGTLPPAPMMVLLRMTPLKAVHGEIVVEGEPGEEHYTMTGAVYGGYAASLLDAVMGSAVLTTVPAGGAAPTQSFEIKLLRPITSHTGKVTARGRVVHRGSRQATAEATLVAADSGKLLASGTSTCLIVT